MYSITAFIVLIVFGFSSGVPLENPSDDMAKFFPSNRIVGGTNAPSTPHMAALVFGSQVISLICGATIITPKLFLSAAHCIDMFVMWDELLPTLRGNVGSAYWHSPGTAVDFEGYYIHSGWTWSTIKDDIGILVLKELLKFSSTVGAMALNFDRIVSPEPCYVTGWGMLGAMDIIPDQLQILHVNTVIDQICVAQVAAISGGFGAQVDPRIEICTFHSAGHGTCNGDSGSALVSTRTNNQIGIVSWGFPCAIGAPDVYTRVSAYRDFIENITAKYI